MKIQWTTQIIGKEAIDLFLGFMSFFTPSHVSKWCFKHPKLILLVFLFIFFNLFREVLKYLGVFLVSFIPEF